MNTRTLLATAILSMAAAGSAFAQEATTFPAVDTHSSVSRAEVRAEAILALQRGDLSEAAFLAPNVDAAAHRSRQAVHAETLRAQRSGSIDRLDAEAYNFLG